MAKSTKALSGAAKDAYLKRTIRAEGELPEPVRDRLTERLQSEIATVSLRAAAVGDPPAAETEPVEAIRVGVVHARCAADAPEFDPYSPNVVVAIRTRGREAVLDQLGRIEDVDNLRLLAREQQLGIASDLSRPDEIRAAIVAAAERRIANRRAAAS
ncbi:MAG: hypothetical protein SFW09_18300 [Hyphomicrobiaceae bacterium]|nr:hypothetical protein [Hyphomicrobiaceae bacterium]